MRVPGTALLALAMLLAATIVWEVANRRAVMPVPRPAATEVVALRPHAAVPAAVPGLAAEVADILARPLFSPDRRPPPASELSPAGRSLPRLAGVIVGPRTRVAIFAPPGRVRAVLVNEGGRIADSRVMRIREGSVVVVGPHGEQVLHPRLLPQKTVSQARTTLTLAKAHGSDPGAQPSKSGEAALVESKRAVIAKRMFNVQHDSPVRFNP